MNFSCSETIAGMTDTFHIVYAREIITCGQYQLGLLELLGGWRKEKDRYVAGSTKMWRLVTKLSWDASHMQKALITSVCWSQMCSAAFCCSVINKFESRLWAFYVSEL